MLRLSPLGSLFEAFRPPSSFHPPPPPLVCAARASSISVHQRTYLSTRTRSPAQTPWTTSPYLMHRRDSDTDISERVRKRRRISTASPARNSPHQAMDIHLTPIESSLRTLLLDVAQYIREQEIVNGGSDVKNHPETVLRFTGGWVRDKLLGRVSHDIDVGISSMTGYQFGMALKQYLDVPKNLAKYRRNHPNGDMRNAIVSLHKIEANPEKSKHLETVTTKIFGLEIDLVNLRRETYSEDSRNPLMEFGTAVEDALRRDATINALFYNLNESRLEDLTGRGLEDMRNKIIRTPLEPYQTFKDDPLRVLRLIRFASRLGYQIDPETQKAMKNEDISAALKLKISKERVGTELDKMLRGPDPRGALEFIHGLGLYATIFANHQDEVTADISAWPLSYNALARLFSPDPGESEALRAAAAGVRKILLPDEQSCYYAWMITAFAPWSAVPDRIATGPEGKPRPPRVVEVGRDSLRLDNKSLTVLRDVVRHCEEIIACKSALLSNTMNGTPAEIRQQIGLQMRSWGKDWKACVLLALLREVMSGRDFAQVVPEYSRFLGYIVAQGLEDVCDLKPMVNGDEIMRALGAPKGRWMSKALTLVMEWQLLHPEMDDKQKALDEICGRRAELGL